MYIGLLQAAALAVMMTTTAWGQDKPACDSKGNIKTPELVEGRVSKMDRSQGKLTVRDGGGKEYEFFASNETLEDIKIGDTIKAKLREAPQCPEK
ncbi:MAG TPA: OB-fold nucleic acid binding domain-containing protein [Candidatus Binatia bacterium]|nr:OB-fold nucleic acid binding domain-containing protein [Candidatus Binatia bacterium]